MPPDPDHLSRHPCRLTRHSARPRDLNTDPHKYTNTYTCTHTHAHKHTNTYTHKHTHTHAHTQHTHTHAHTHLAQLPQQPAAPRHGGGAAAVLPRPLGCAAGLRGHPPSPTCSPRSGQPLQVGPLLLHPGPEVRAAGACTPCILVLRRGLLLPAAAEKGKGEPAQATGSGAVGRCGGMPLAQGGGAGRGLPTQCRCCWPLAHGEAAAPHWHRGMASAGPSPAWGGAGRGGKAAQAQGGHLSRKGLASSEVHHPYYERGFLTNRSTDRGRAQPPLVRRGLGHSVWSSGSSKSQQEALSTSLRAPSALADMLMNAMSCMQDEATQKVGGVGACAPTAAAL